MERYVDHKLIGSGSYGNVYKAFDTVTKEYVAIKALKFEGSDIPAYLQREIAVLRMLKHPNIVFEYVEQDLASYARSYQQSAADIRKIQYQILSAVAYFHSNSIMHRDLKLENILITSSGMVKVADFGLARAMVGVNGSYEEEVVTLWYRAPEQLVGATQYNFAVDVWAVGCVAAELLSGKPFFPGEDEYSQLMLIFQQLGTPSISDFPYLQHISKVVPIQSYPPQPLGPFVHDADETTLSLVRGLLHVNQNERLCARDALSHEYFTSIRP